MEESVIATFDNVKFIEGETLMTQGNWQEYFSQVIPNGVYSGFDIRNYVGATAYSNGRRIITDGVVFVNGIYAKIETDNGYTDIGTIPDSTGGTNNRFVCVRVYFAQEKAQIVSKNNISTSGSFASTVMNFFNDESYNCTRNIEYWDIPLFFQTEDDSMFDQGVDLRRFAKKQEIQINPDYGIKNPYSHVVGISGGNTYTFTNIDPTAKLHVYFDVVNPPKHARLIVNRTTELSSDHIHFHNIPYVTNLIYNPNRNDVTFYNVGMAKYPKNGSVGVWTVEQTGSDRVPLYSYSDVTVSDLEYHTSSEETELGQLRPQRRVIFEINYMGKYDSSGSTYYMFHIDVIHEAVVIPN